MDELEEPIDRISSEWFESRRKEGDLMGEVPVDFVLKDERFNESEYQAFLENGPYQEVDQHLQVIKTGSFEGERLDKHGRVDEELTLWIKKMVYHVFKVNRELKKPDLTPLELKLLVWEMWQVDHLHGVPDYGQNGRRNGESYSRGHLFQSLLNGVTLVGITDLSFLIALLHHDDFEDLTAIHEEGNPDPNKILVTSVYPDFFQDELNDSKEKHVIGRLRSSIFALIRSVTNAKQRTSNEVKEVINTLALVRNMQEHGALVMLIRACERIHNLGTLMGLRDHGKIDSANAKLKESMDHLVPLLRILGTHDLYVAMVKACFMDSRQETVDEFETMSSKKRTERLSDDKETRKNLDARLQEIREDDGVVYIAYRPSSPFSPELNPLEEGLNSSLNRSGASLEPLFTVEILVKEDKDLSRVQEKLKTALQLDSLSGLTVRRGKFMVYSPELGGRIQARVRTIRTARLTQSGVLKGSTDEALPRDLDERVRIFLASIDEDTPVESVRELYRFFLNQQGAVFLTPDGKDMDIRLESTVLDAAAKIHGKLLACCEGALEWENPAFGNGIPLAPFDRVLISRKPEIEPLLIIQKAPQMQLKPQSVFFASEPHTVRRILDLLSTLTVEIKQQFGREHLEEVAELLDLDSQDLIHFLLTHKDHAVLGGNEDLFFKKIGQMLINPLAELISQVDPKDGINFEVDLPDTPGYMNAFLARFGQANINLNFLGAQENYRDEHGEKRTKFLLRFETLPGVKVPLFEIMKLAFRIKQVYPIQVKSQRFKKLLNPEPTPSSVPQR